MPNGGYTDDGLILEEVGPWAKEKHRLVGYYAGMFARSLKRKWKNRIYIDLFSGPGLSVIKETGEIVDSSAFKAMDIKEPFDRYYFCDCDHEKVDALRQRQDRYFPAIDAEFFHCDANAGVEELKASLPTPSREESMLCFTLLDIYRLTNLRFRTVEILSEYYMDFLVLMPTYMEMRRWERDYVEGTCSIVDEFLGQPTWRSDWAEYKTSGRGFSSFILEAFGRKMSSLGYVDLGPAETHPIYEKGRKILYHLAFYSRDELGVKFWRKARDGVSGQMTLPYED